MPFTTLKFPPGVWKNGTKYQAKGRWFDANLIRFREGAKKPVGGWQLVKGFSTVLALDSGVWQLADSLDDQDGVFTADTNTVYSPNNDVNAMGAVGIRLVGTTAQLADTQYRSMVGWDSNAGIPNLIIGGHDAIYTFVQGTTTTVTPTGLVGGDADSSYSTGNYGTGAYGVGPYGTGDATQSVLTEAASWQLDTFGEDIVGVLTSDGKLWQWDLSAGGLMTQPAGSPTSNDAVVVTPERFTFMLGAGGDPRKVQWPDQESLTVWTPTSTNQAGDFILPGSGTLMCGRRGRNETLIFTTNDLFVAQYIGGTLIYSFRPVGSACGIISRHAVAMVDGKAIWMGHNGFFTYDGFVRPLPSDVTGHIFDDFNRTQRAKIWAQSLSDQGEVWWFYPSASSLEPDRFATWSYRENHWTIGQVVRTAGIDRSAFDFPMMVNQAGVYDHERGSTRVGAAVPHLESGPVEVGMGDQVLSIQNIIPDESTQTGQVLGSLRAFLFTAIYPTATETKSSAFTLANPTSVRLTARQVRFRVEEVTAGDWRLGDVRLEGVPGGRR